MNWFEFKMLGLTLCIKRQSEKNAFKISILIFFLKSMRNFYGVMQLTTIR